MMYLGIDPGLSGGIAVLREDGAIEFAERMPPTERDLLDLMLRVWPSIVANDARAVLERVSASPQMGVVSAFTFGRHYGTLLMALTAARVPFSQVVPAKWQTVMQCRSGGDKNITKRRAQQLWPAHKITHAIADALLLAAYCRQLERPVERRPS